MLESTYQARLIKVLEELFPGCVILKNDANLRQGFPDLTVLYGERWAVLEVKASGSARYRPNQEWYLERCSEMSFAATIYPENEQEILVALQQAFGPRGQTRRPQRKQQRVG